MLMSGLHVGRYRLERLIAEGGTSEVWCGRHRVLGSRRALKVLHPDGPPMDQGTAEQAAIRHPNVLPVVEVARFEERPVLVMPLVEGPSLRQQRRTLTPSEARAVFEGILAGVEAVHAAGLVHCDLKPDNVLLVQEGDRIVPKVTDFGISVRQGGVVAPGWGTRGYAAPEQLRGEPPTVASDFYALGVLLHELLTGRRPAPALAASIEATWGDLLRGLLEPDPAKRTRDAATVRTQLASTGVRLQPLRRSSLALELGAAAPSEVTAPTAAAPGSRPPPGWLPVPDDPFVGRSEAIAALTAALGEPGVVTLTGPGGVGKTRLALEVAQQLGVACFVDLTEARTRDEVVRRVGEALQVPIGTTPSAERIGAALAGRSERLVVDNLEQVAQPAGELLAQWCAAAPALSVLATSRERLGIDTERVQPVEPLSLAGDAVDLLCVRMAALGVADEVPRDVLQRIATLLDGLPLAIELAAARAATLSPRELEERLSHRFDVLVSRDASRPDRHRTLEGTLDWSWSLLTQPERTALAQLSVFEGGATLQAAEAVLQISEERVETVLAGLVDRSLLRTHRAPGTDEPRLSLLRSVHDYARDRLSEQDTGLATQRRHADWFTRDAMEESFMVAGGVQRTWQVRLDIDNHLAAFRRAATWSDGATATRAAVVLARVGRELGLIPQLLPQIEALQSLPGAPRARVKQLLGYAHAILGRTEPAVSCLEHAIALARQDGDERLEMLASLNLGNALWITHRPSRARPPLERARQLAQQLGSLCWEASVLSALCPLASKEGDEAAAIALAEQGLALVKQVGDRQREAMLFNHLGVSYSRGTDHAKTRRHYEQALAIHRELHNSFGQAWVLQNLAALDVQEERYDEGANRLQEAFRRFREVGAVRNIARRRDLQAGICWHQGDREGALRAVALGEATLRELGDKQGLGFVLLAKARFTYQVGQREAARAALGEATDLIGHLELDFVKQLFAEVEATLTTKV